MVGSYDHWATAGDVFNSFDFNAEILSHNFSKKSRENPINQSVSIHPLEIENLLRWIFKKIDHIDS